MTYNEIMNNWKVETDKKRAEELKASKERYDAWVAAGCPDEETIPQKILRTIGTGIAAAGIKIWCKQKNLDSKTFG